MGKSYGFNIDWWGYGILIYEMLIGLPPFTHENKNELYHQILNKTPNFKYTEKDIHISSDAKNLILSLLMKDSDKRINPDKIKSHPWFSNMDFEELYNGNIPSLFKPEIVIFILLRKVMMILEILMKTF